MARVIALIVAVAMVAGALFLRERLERPSTPVSAEDGDQSGPPTLACAAELRAACEAVAADRSDLTLRVEPAGDTLAVIADAAGDPPELWLVPQPWPEMAAIVRDGAGTPGGIGEQSPVLARSPLVLVGFQERLEVLAPVCGGEVTWRCLGEQAGRPWSELGLDAGTGTVRPGHLNPTTSATGLLVLGAAVTSFAGRTDLNRNDLATETFTAWFTALESAIPGFTPTSGSLVRDMLTRGVASYDVVGTTEAEASGLLAVAPPGPQPLEQRPSEPLATADIVLVALPDAGGLDQRLAEELRDALAETGWQVEGADGPPLSEGAGLPSAGFLLALQERWEEVAR